MMSHVPIQIPLDKGKVVDAVLTLGKKKPKAGKVGVILTHGASGDKDSGHLPALAEAFAPAGFPCLRFTCKPPNMNTRIKYWKAVLNETTEMEQLEGITEWVFAGHSMGARVACAMAEETSSTVRGCMLFSYPLHPPGKPDQLRDDPLCKLELPLMFIRGTRDTFSTKNAWESIQPRLSSNNLKVEFTRQLSYLNVSGSFLQGALYSEFDQSDSRIHALAVLAAFSLTKLRSFDKGNRQYNGNDVIHAVEGGDHSLKVKGGKAANDKVVSEFCEAAVDFVREVAEGEAGKTTKTSRESRQTHQKETGETSAAAAGLRRSTRKRRQPTLEGLYGKRPKS